jgi:peptide/nickel transport system substrate-binding protein
MPAPDLERAESLLREAGITEKEPLRLDLWWPSDHYGSREPDLATTLKLQMESTGLVKVTLHDAPWQRYTAESAGCSYPAYLLGWQPDYLDVSTSVDFFALSTATGDLCSNFASADMDRLILAAQTERDPARRLELYAQIQELWAVEVPTVPLLQGTVSAVTFGDVAGVVIDPSGMLHYGELRKGSGGSS